MMIFRSIAGPHSLLFVLGGGLAVGFVLARSGALLCAASCSESFGFSPRWGCLLYSTRGSVG